MRAVKMGPIPIFCINQRNRCYYFIDTMFKSGPNADADVNVDAKCEQDFYLKYGIVKMFSAPEKCVFDRANLWSGVRICCISGFCVCAKARATHSHYCCTGNKLLITIFFYWWIWFELCILCLLNLCVVSCISGILSTSHTISRHIEPGARQFWEVKS